MNLKDAFRYQNTLNGWIIEISEYLTSSVNVTEVTQEHMRSKSRQNATDETVVVNKDRIVDCNVNKLIDFAMDLYHNKLTLSDAISNAKKSLNVDIDKLVSMNKTRQEISGAFTRMSSIKSSEIIRRGTGYTFNVAGDQTAYNYDIKEVTTINFDRNKTKAISKNLLKECDEVSSCIDRLMIDTMVDYQPVYDVNDNFEDVLEKYLAI